MSNVIKISEFAKRHLDSAMDEMDVLMNNCDKLMDKELIEFAELVSIRIEEKSEEVKHWKELYIQHKKSA